MSKSLTRRALLSRGASLVAAFALALAVSACGNTAAPDAPAAQPQGDEPKIAVTVTIDASAADVEASTSELELDEGATAYDALVATGADVNAKESSYGMYVAGINGVAEGDFGDMSGWLFAVNDEMAEVGCSELVLEDGDVVVWSYTTDFTQM